MSALTIEGWCKTSDAQKSTPMGKSISTSTDLSISVWKRPKSACRRPKSLKPWSMSIWTRWS